MARVGQCCDPGHVALAAVGPSLGGAPAGCGTRYAFSVLLDPQAQAASPLLESIVSAPDRSALARATEASYLDLSPPTDARPFFFNQLRLDRLFDQDVFALASRPGVYGGNLSATLTLAMLILISAVSRRSDDRRSAAVDREHDGHPALIGRRNRLFRA